MKSLARTERTLAIIFWMLVIQSAAGFLPSLYVWRWPSRLEMAFGLGLGLDLRDRILWDVFPLLHGARDAVCGRNRRAAHGFPEGSADRRRRLADLFGAAGHVHFAWRCADPCRQSLEPQSRR